MIVLIRNNMAASLVIMAFFFLSQISWSHQESTSLQGENKRLLDQHLDNYDSRIRPSGANGTEKPVDVTVNIMVSAIPSVSDYNMVRPLFSTSTESSTKPTETSPIGVDDLYFNGNTSDSKVRRRIIFQASLTSLTEPKRKKLILTLSALSDEDIRTCSNSPSTYQKFCEFTNDSNRFAEADAVIFRQKDLNILPLLLSNRTNTQVWIYNSPSPTSPNIKQQIEKYKNVFNLSATYDFRSHLPMLPMYFFTRNISRTYVKKDVTSDIVTVAVYNKDCEEEEIFRRKYKHVLQALLKGNDLRVDWFRGCSNKSSECHDLTSAQCYQTIAPRYKFALAFETSDADFISERFFDPLNNTVIPIVIGNSTKATYEDLSIKGSFIFWCDFDNVKQLKNELKELNTNSTKLEEYFKWLNKGKFYSNKRWYCQVCSMLFRATTTTAVEDMTVFL